MLESIKQHGRDDEQGFTLIELMVVVLIIAILLAIAIPTFLGARNSANSRAAQSSLRNALTAEQTYWTNNQTFGDSASTPSITTIEPNLNWVTTALSSTNSPNDISVTLLDSNGATPAVYSQVALQSFGKDGSCYTVIQNNDSNITPTGGNTGYSVQKGSCPTPAALASTSTITAGSASSSASTTSGGTFYTKW